MSNLPQLKKALSTDLVKSKFSDMLGKKTAGFMSSIISAVSGNSALEEVDHNSIIMAAAVAASLDLPINQNLGFAYIVPYKDKAQFQIGYKGFIQLAMRTGLYRTMNASVVYEGELIDYDRIKGYVKIDQTKKKSEKIVGYVFYFALTNGFEKYFYMTKEECREHGEKYSKSYNNKNSRWQIDFDSMALKTVIKLSLAKYGVLSIEMQNAVTFDQAVINDVETQDVYYIDATNDALKNKDFVDKKKEKIKDNKKSEASNQAKIDLP